MPGPLELTSSQYIVRGPQPAGREGLVMLKMRGVETILNLRKWDRSVIYDEREWCEELGMRFVHVPMSPFLPPAEQDLWRCADLMASWTARRQRGYVHCMQGEDRTGMAVAAWRILHLGQTYPAVLADMLDNGFHIGRFFWWLPVLRKLAAEAGRL